MDKFLELVKAIGPSLAIVIAAMYFIGRWVDKHFQWFQKQVERSRDDQKDQDRQFVGALSDIVRSHERIVEAFRDSADRIIDKVERLK